MIFLVIGNSLVSDEIKKTLDNTTRVFFDQNTAFEQFILTVSQIFQMMILLMFFQSIKKSLKTQKIILFFLYLHLQKK
jgi:hypothetical protein